MYHCQPVSGTTALLIVACRVHALLLLTTKINLDVIVRTVVVGGTRGWRRMIEHTVVVVYCNYID